MDNWNIKLNEIKENKQLIDNHKTLTTQETPETLTQEKNPETQQQETLYNQLKQENQKTNKKLTLQELQKEYENIMADYTQTETDPTIMLEAPALRDTNVPTTAAFHKLYPKIQETLYNTKNKKPDLQKLNQNIQQLKTTWETAIETALQIGLNGLSTIDKRRAEAAYNKAFDPAATQEEAIAAGKLLIKYLDKIIITKTTPNNTTKTQHLNGIQIFQNHINTLSIEKKFKQLMLQ